MSKYNTMNSFYRIFVLVFCINSLNQLSAQTGNLETLEKGIVEYNKLHALSESAAEGTVSAAELSAMEEMLQNGTAHFDAVLLSPADSLHNIAQYLKNTILYDYVQTLFQSGNTTKAASLLLGMDKGMNKLAELTYPLIFEGNTKAMTIQWSDFVPQLFKYNVQVGEQYFASSQYDTALVFIRKARDLNDWDTRQMTLNTDRLVRIKESKNEYDEEMLESVLLLMTNYGDMDQAARTNAPQLNEVPQRCQKIIEKILKGNADLSDNGEVWARTYRMLVNEQMNGPALDFAQNAFDAGYKDHEFLLSVFPLAITENRKDLARKVIDQYAADVESTECDNLTVVADNYTTLKEDILAQKFRDKAEKCAKAKAKEIKVSGRDGGLYVGTYVFPWIRTDWGAVAAIQTRKHLFEFSYQSLSDRRDRLYDLRIRGVDGAADQKVRWDGYYTHFAASRIKGKKGARKYSGILLGYNLREFQPMVVNTITNELGETLNTKPEVFKAKEQRYIFMLNGGLHSYGRYFASDFYMGYGLSWNSFDRGNANFDNKNYNYEDNALLNGRKAGRMSFMMRIGVTIGFQLGPRTFEPKKKAKKESQS